MGNRFVTGEQVRLPLSGGDHIDIKKRLSHGEREEMFARMAPTSVAGEDVLVNTREVRTAKVLAYLLGWSFTDEKNQPVPYHLGLAEADRASAICNLTTDDFDEVNNAIAAHELAIHKAREALKKTPATEPASEAIS